MRDNLERSDSIYRLIGLTVCSNDDEGGRDGEEAEGEGEALLVAVAAATTHDDLGPHRHHFFGPMAQPLFLLSNLGHHHYTNHTSPITRGCRDDLRDGEAVTEAPAAASWYPPPPVQTWPDSIDTVWLEFWLKKVCVSDFLHSFGMRLRIQMELSSHFLSHNFSHNFPIESSPCPRTTSVEISTHYSIQKGPDSCLTR